MMMMMMMMMTPIGKEEHLLLGDHGLVTVSSKLRASVGQRPLSAWNKSQGSLNGGTLSSRCPVRGQGAVLVSGQEIGYPSMILRN